MSHTIPMDKHSTMIAPAVRRKPGRPAGSRDTNPRKRRFDSEQGVMGGSPERVFQNLGNDCLIDFSGALTKRAKVEASPTSHLGSSLTCHHGPQKPQAITPQLHSQHDELVMSNETLLQRLLNVLSTKRETQQKVLQFQTSTSRQSMVYPPNVTPNYNVVSSIQEGCKVVPNLTIPNFTFLQTTTNPVSAGMLRPSPSSVPILATAPPLNCAQFPQNPMFFGIKI